MPETNLKQIIDEYLDRLMAEKGAGALDVAEQEKMRAELEQKLEEKIGRAMIDALPDAKLIELEQLLDMGAADEVLEKFFTEAQVDYAEATKAATEEFTREELGGAERSVA